MEQTDTFFSQRLDNNIQVVGQPMVGVESAAVGFLIGTGARDEQPADYGVSHFTEQMLFRGTEHYDARQLSEAFDALGIDYDSSAGLEMTLVNSLLIGTRLQKAIELLADVIRYPSFPEDSVENVRTLIQQEIRQREDKPAQKVMETLRQKFFANSPLGHDSLGTPETIESIGRSDLVRYWRERFTANNMVVSVAGNFDWEAVVAQLAEITREWPQGAGRGEFDPPATSSGITVMEREAAQENIGFAFPGVTASDAKYYTAALLSQALGGSSNSRLFQEVREKRGLAYAVQSRFDGLEKVGIFRIYVGTSAERAHESVEVVLEVLRNLERDGITEEELRLSKTKLKSSLVMRSESTSARMAANLRSWWFEERLRGLDEVKSLIDRVTLDDVRDLAQSLNMTKDMAAVAIGPRTEEELFGGVLTAS